MSEQSSDPPIPPPNPNSSDAEKDPNPSSSTPTSDQPVPSADVNTEVSSGDADVTMVEEKPKEDAFEDIPPPVLNVSSTFPLLFLHRLKHVIGTLRPYSSYPYIDSCNFGDPCTLRLFLNYTSGRLRSNKQRMVKDQC